MILLTFRWHMKHQTRECHYHLKKQHQWCRTHWASQALPLPCLGPKHWSILAAFMRKNPWTDFMPGKPICKNWFLKPLSKVMRSTLDMLPALELWPFRSIKDKVRMQQHLRDGNESIENGSHLRGFTSTSMIVGEGTANSMQPETTYHHKFMLDTAIICLPHIKSNVNELRWVTCSTWAKALSHNKFVKCTSTCSRCNSLGMSIKHLLMP